MEAVAAMRLVKLMLALSLFGLAACTEPGQTTAVGAATGGVLGAGLGAIVGNQVGDAGTGLAVGALAGAGSGAAIGNALEAQQQAIRTQDEAIERQDKMIKAQNAELEELRRSARDGSHYQGPVALKPSASVKGLSRRPLTERDLTRRGAGLSETTVAAGDKEGLAAYRWDENTEPQSKTGAAKETSFTKEELNLDRSLASSDLTPECRKAFDEVSRITPDTEKSERLFYYRRALRLCPGEAAFHNGLGEVYLVLNRREDAEFEFREALRLNPAYETARNNLKSIQD